MTWTGLLTRGNEFVVHWGEEKDSIYNKRLGFFVRVKRLKKNLKNWKYRGVESKRGFGAALCPLSKAVKTLYIFEGKSTPELPSFY